MLSVSEVVERIVGFAKSIAANECETVKPGQPVRFTEASTVNDRIWQGDLSLTITEDKVPDGYKPVQTMVQLVPGNTVGSKHCLDGTSGVEMFLPEVWNEESLNGPWMRLTEERTVLHPIHGSVTIPAGFCVAADYQREYDLELQRERRAAD